MTSAHDWRARTGDAWADEWRRTDRSFAELTPHLLAAILSAAPLFSRAIDLGCGAGETTLAVVRMRPEARLVGIDLSDALVRVAQGRTASVMAGSSAPGASLQEKEHRPEGRNASFVTGDVVEVAGEHGPFDLFLSRHGVMFFADPVDAFARLRRAALPGAALVFSCFGERARNVFASELLAEVTGEQPTEPDSHAPGPFAFASRDRVAGILASSGWSAASAIRVDYAYVAGQGADAVRDAKSFFSRIGPVAAAIAGAEPERRKVLLNRLGLALERWHDGSRVALPASAWIWTAFAGERA